MAPEIPVPAQTFGLAERSEIAVVGLGSDQLRDDVRREGAQICSSAQRERLDG